MHVFVIDLDVCHMNLDHAQVLVLKFIILSLNSSKSYNFQPETSKPTANTLYSI